MAKTNPQIIRGKWLFGVALDYHILFSTHLGINEQGHDVFDTVRTELGELLFRLKYRSDRSAAPEIIDTASVFLRQYRDKFDLLVPVPPSGHRPVQPVIIIARGIEKSLNLPVIECVTLTRSATQLKGVQGREKRAELLQGLHAVEASKTKDKNILLFDDLYRSGATMNAITDLLLDQGKARSVRVLTITKTKRN